MKQLSTVAFAALCYMLNMEEGTTESEMEDRLLKDAADRRNSFESNGTATKSEVEAFAAEIAALKAENAELKASATGADNSDLEAAQQLAETRATEISTLNSRITELEAEIVSLKKQPAAQHSSTDAGKETRNNDDVPSYMRSPLTLKAKALHDARMARAN